MAGTKGRKRLAGTTFGKLQFQEEFRSLEGSGEPWQAWGTRRVGTWEHLTSSFLAMSSV